MDPELKRLLEENLAVAKDNNGILRSMRHHQWLSSLLSAVFWIAVVVAPLFFYQQYLAPIMSRLYGGSGSPTSTELQKLLNSFQAGTSTR